MISGSYLVLSAAGTVSYHAYFKHRENHLRIVLYIQVLANILIAEVLLFQHQEGLDLAAAFTQAARIQGSIFNGLFGCRITSRFLPAAFPRSDAFRQVHRLHDLHGPFYDISYPMVSLQTMRNKKPHEERRHVWSAAFGDKAVRGYEQQLRRYLDDLVDYFSSQAVAGKPLNITKWFELYSYDFMGDLTLGKSFGMLEAQKDHWAIHLLKQAMIPLGLYLPTWFFRVTPPEIPDVASVLVAPIRGQQPSREQWELLRGDAQLVVLAGSDTTATILAAAMYQVVRHPEQVQRLRDEVSPYITDPLHDIPGNMTVMCPQYVLGRDEKAHERPKEFLPEREARCHFPLPPRQSVLTNFSLGPYGCNGKPLALLTLRSTLVRLVTMFDFEYAPGEDGTAFEGKAKDRFTMSYGDLQTLFRVRRKM
ncbi:cytochrome P450 [Aspergillus costaricaensis CBS 115574]|uniref:Cytochrome P450 n=1 Tax=Aspergillus costaricaensis CBS 115574 TaxID=1448317 RepID=A0ACD1IHA1_9EURO|nr:cytochrome P450 [Aspergillus costaricaensis CBS 115574]RAK89618.1 cytochrome P450 [Aspergillus costaricaensis CBS 115574]